MKLKFRSFHRIERNYVSATRSVVELARGTWCCKANTDWRFRTDDLVSERFILTKPGQFLGESRSEQFIPKFV